MIIIRFLLESDSLKTGDNDFSKVFLDLFRDFIDDPAKFDNELFPRF
ncbi:hypothetical protein LEP1GSC137_4611 [Leptospira borgpetersenii str. Noumea 25]|uniref:Uncharacterized protein n=2 Tax=Leptospira borgpetersenii TaxID=174 RepID=M3FGD0_LEPBO|nr:hypothetical protein LBBP_01345 [Leptospira borgpetersenii serovar Ballum]EKQ93674.1 hypothetical protein LEP1GSC101_0405 [Leptospira borgpetersenii str. UI 09149]EKR00748.1 hypothetical protein LEP1GSC121_0034 [Leptospira borgpetersenii serovar Castellonis str. 200801910]EMG00913.1 hypothetical protein LEP1GSC123_3265 [Leptospira borgpetersenii str. 200701203]EMK11686.1 hypothetical protein LEP1GSC066_1554 [Leptospira sp. serovar Kenya str. Sh9]EMN13207.1 hypothetical protein LEP1GSC055_20